MAHKLYQVNAFTARGQNGNPAGVVLDAKAISTERMQVIARDAGFSEAAFVLPHPTATHELRFFTPVNEIDLCGHATIASWSLLHQQGLEPGQYTQQTRAGRLGISVLPDGRVFMEQNRATFGQTIAPAAIASLLSIPETDFDRSLSPQIVSTGVADLFIPVRSKDVLNAIKPKLDGIIAFSRKHRISSFHVFSLLEKAESLAAARNFAPIDGIDEEAATGTSTGALLCYLRDQGRLPEQAAYRIEQGEAMNRRSYIYGKFISDIVWVGGAATIVNSKTI